MTSLASHEERIRIDTALLCEIAEIAEPAMRALAVADFDDIGDAEIVILAAIAGGRSVQSIADAFAAAGISGGNVRKGTDRLVKQKYLEIKENPRTPGSTRVNITPRGHAAHDVIIHVFRIERWTEFPFQSTDIVISTAPKSGTTWLQMICALLVFQTPDLPAPLAALSPWLENDSKTRDDLLNLLADQNHRRFIKSHLRLSEIPMDPRVRYIVVVRHPLDTLLSFYHHQENLRMEPRQGVKAQQPSVRELLLHYLDTGGTDDSWRLTPATVLRQAAAAWAYRERPNVMLLHYEDLSADLAGEMRRLAAWLEISVPESSWPRLVKAATFEQMRAVASQLRPMPMREPEKFFRSGRSGMGRDLLEADELSRYYDLAARLVPPDLMTWLHREYSR
jgi:aryl sulfotransferase